jgi:hypothetical protein
MRPPVAAQGAKKPQPVAAVDLGVLLRHGASVLPLRTLETGQDAAENVAGSMLGPSSASVSAPVAPHPFLPEVLPWLQIESGRESHQEGAN